MYFSRIVLIRHPNAIAVIQGIRRRTRKMRCRREKTRKNEEEEEEEGEKERT